MDSKKIRKLVRNPGSFGGLRRVGIRDAIDLAVRTIRSGAGYFIKSDIPGFFTKIPRKRALELLCSNLPDASINELLDQATTVELSNLADLRERAGLFPSHELGVAQGCCLSPLLGNLSLGNFDEEMNSDGIVCLRYIDDFLILSPNKPEAWAAFRKAKRILSGLGMEAYDPKKDPGKAAAGSTRKSFEFLGCDISSGFIHPNLESRRRVLTKVKEILSVSRSAMAKGLHSGTGGYEYSVVESLRLVSKTLNGWAKHYSFCNSTQLFAHLDKEIDHLIASYFEAYFILRNQSGGDRERTRRMLGVTLLADVEWDSILPGSPSG